MGFKLAGRVYSEIKNTTPTEQAILAYLAFRADDATGRCFPTRDTIHAATHLKPTGISNGLNGLREKNILKWIKGGRAPKSGGKAMANEYLFNFPELSTKLSIKGVNEHTTFDTICRDAATIIKHHNQHQSSVIKGAQSENDPMKDSFRKMAIEVGRQWLEKRPAPKTEEPRSLLEHALDACGLTINNRDDYWAFCTAMRGKDYGLCEDEILAFESEIRQGEHKNARNLAAILMSRLQNIPKSNSLNECPKRAYRHRATL